jgi:2-polyprenyl-3-methyl-5-hydroxy-6-metoxy-1,4-benzoquinol methylase
MVDYSQRSTAPEFMDEASVTGPELESALKELEYVNRYLGGIRVTLRALERCLRQDTPSALTILDLGTGAADIPRAIAQWARARQLNVRIVAVDFNASVCDWARQRTHAFPEVDLQEADVFALPFAPESFDYVHCALFLHHFPQQEASAILHLMYTLCRKGIIVNDLHRHPVAFHAITWITRCLSRSPMVKHDAPVSVLRGFQRPELIALGRLSGVSHLAIQRFWPFRFLVTAQK